MDKIIVLIPIYRTQIDRGEKKNLRNIVSKLCEYEIEFIAPNSLDTSWYECEYEHIDIERFEDRYFEGIAGYNKLMLVSDLYKRFSQYEFVCICQLDVWIVQSGRCIDEFVELEYDYIGAPWIPQLQEGILPHKNKIEREINKILPKYKLNVGNGGFSLRRTDSFCKVQQKYSKKIQHWGGSEDAFFSVVGEYWDDTFKVAPVEVAARFSLEKNAKEYVYENGVIPVAVHAYEKWWSELSDEVINSNRRKAVV